MAKQCMRWLVLIFLLADPRIASSETKITAINFEKCLATETCVPVTRWTEKSPELTPPDIRIVVTVANLEAADDLFLLSTTEYIVTSFDTYSAGDFEKLRSGNEVGWGQFRRDDDLCAIPMRINRSEANRQVVVRTLDLAKILPDFRNDPDDYLWPWVIRVNTFLIDREGRSRSALSAILELEPSRQRVAREQAPE